MKCQLEKPANKLRCTIGRIWIVNYRVVQRLSLDDVLQHSTGRPTVFTYKAAAKLSGIGFPDEQSKFFQHLGIRQFAIVARTQMLTISGSNSRLNRFLKPVSENQLESRRQLKRIVAHWKVPSLLLHTLAPYDPAKAQQAASIDGVSNRQLHCADQAVDASPFSGGFIAQRGSKQRGQVGKRGGKFVRTNRSGRRNGGSRSAS
ncbi:hypothetical protein LOC68_01745 [Blastopirellula sp. JC732]|uniref:Uncharacterized protein n=1 Tax=Blastopirellula sediminis TaxID=2894196 RepID=A0A9X1SEC7_9BACT|nr:hypothetical protein [Blastopirellula sediminis]MCC9608089.1 hypothetical protein [Blastopirellula sediminis]MCC9627118.1 hypothetical protein [Blastopirellula sediminis]